jgi:hypothetical protein
MEKADRIKKITGNNAPQLYRFWAVGGKELRHGEKEVENGKIGRF